MIILLSGGICGHYTVIFKSSAKKEREADDLFISLCINKGTPNV